MNIRMVRSGGCCEARELAGFEETRVRTSPLLCILVTGLETLQLQLQVKLKTMHTANRSHVTSDALVSSLNGGCQAIGITVYTVVVGKRPADLGG